MPDGRSGPPVFAFAAPSGTGKTTVLERLIAHLDGKGLVVGAIKSDAHRIELDTPGKDTHRMRAAGAATTAIVSKDQIALFNDRGSAPLPLPNLIETFFQDCDLVLLEGFRALRYPTVLVHRDDVSREGWSPPEVIIAIVSDAGFRCGDTPVFSFDELDGLAAFLLESAQIGDR